MVLFPAREISVPRLASQQGQRHRLKILGMVFYSSREAFVPRMASQQIIARDLGLVLVLLLASLGLSIATELAVHSPSACTTLSRASLEDSVGKAVTAPRHGRPVSLHCGSMRQTGFTETRTKPFQTCNSPESQEKGNHSVDSLAHRVRT